MDKILYTENKKKDDEPIEYLERTLAKLESEHNF